MQAVSECHRQKLGNHKDRPVYSENTSTVSKDGTVKSKEKTVTQSSDGTVTKTEETKKTTAPEKP